MTSLPYSAYLNKILQIFFWHNSQILKTLLRLQNRMHQLIALWNHYNSYSCLGTAKREPGSHLQPPCRASRAEEQGSNNQLSDYFFNPEDRGPQLPMPAHVGYLTKSAENNCTSHCVKSERLPQISSSGGKVCVCRGGGEIAQGRNGKAKDWQ